jgi:3-oxoacyl-[acyl-carrier protein] reductase
MIAEFARRHLERQASWGRIIGLTSGGPMGFPGELSYGAAKAALGNYTMAASVELGRLGVTANMVYPPVTDTGWVTDEVREFVSHSDDHIHVARPEDVAGVILLLCAPGGVNGHGQRRDRAPASARRTARSPRRCSAASTACSVIRCER